MELAKLPQLEPTVLILCAAFATKQNNFWTNFILNDQRVFPRHAFSHMCLVGPLNPYILLQSWELTFLIGLTLLNTKLAKKNFFTNIL